MYILVSENFIAGLTTAPQPEGRLYGEYLPGEDVARFWEETTRPAQALGWWRQGHEPEWPEGAGEPEEGQFLALILGQEITFYRREQGRWQPQPHEVMNLYTDFGSRQQGLFDLKLLAGKRVAIVGLGSGGSLVAAQLAKAGVGHFELFDFDRLGSGNISRHLCGLRDLGRLKVAAVKDALENTNPFVEVNTYPYDITRHLSEVEIILAGCDLVVGAADSEVAKGEINRLAVRLRKPAVYGAVYDMGYGGDIFRYQPPAGACYACFKESTRDIFQDAPRAEVLDYGKIAPQPALEMDVTIIGSLVARVVLAELLAGDPLSQLERLPANWVIWGNRPWEGWIFDEPLQSRFVEISRDPTCPVCQHDLFIQEKLGLAPDEAARQAAALLASLENKRPPEPAS
ncbi:MAG: ThiF family adenylyltransferase [Chloroflexi bacterium]|nr:ThiF family adenylyltransferase [Chloroflexota bacterium]OJV92385.1 MAG: hypothetical protein BGO39_31145 [Chloroflexi bacterium 54-19]